MLPLMWEFSATLDSNLPLEMQSRHLLRVVFALSSLVLSNARDVIDSGHFCHRSSPAGEGRTRLTFLREEMYGIRALYLTLWSEDMRPVRCEVNTDPLVTEGYLSLCNRTGTRHQEITPRFNVSLLLVPDGPCARDSTGAPVGKRAKQDISAVKPRRKRAWIFPGTLWCGTGSKAIGYEQLGMFEPTDRCCREHDHCMHVILAFTVNYGVFNPNFFTVSHCDCDQRFQQCLLGVNDTISNVVGYSFFNFLRVPCFELIQQRRCTQMYWWGMCKVAKEAPYAVFQNPFSYNTTRITRKYSDTGDTNESTNTEGHHVMKRPLTNPNRKLPKGEHRCTSRDPPRGDTFHRKVRKGCSRRRKTSTATSTKVPPRWMTRTTTPLTLAASPVQRTTLTLERLALTSASEINTTIANKKKRGKKKGSRKELTTYATHKSQVLLATTKSYQKTASTTQSTPPTTPRAAPHPQTTIAAVTTITTKSHKKVKKKCRRCEKNSTRLWNTATTTMSIKTKLKTGPQTAVPRHRHGKSPKQRNTYGLLDKTNQKPMITDNQLLCGSLRHLVECKYKIPPLEKKYDLQNMESKTVYHCDCTSRLASQIEHFKMPNILPSLLMDFVSQYCFKLPKEKKCYKRKSCAASFSKASDLLQALKKIEEKDTAGVHKSGKDQRRGIPVHLYRRCLTIVEPGKRG